MYAGLYWSSLCHISPIHQYKEERGETRAAEGGGVSVEGGHCLILKSLHFEMLSLKLSAPHFFRDEHEMKFE